MGGALGWDGLFEASGETVGALEEGDGAVGDGFEGACVGEGGAEEGNWECDGEESHLERVSAKSQGGHSLPFADAMPDRFARGGSLDGLWGLE